MKHLCENVVLRVLVHWRHGVRRTEPRVHCDSRIRVGREGFHRGDACRRAISSATFCGWLLFCGGRLQIHRRRRAASSRARRPGAGVSVGVLRVRGGNHAVVGHEHVVLELGDLLEQLMLREIADGLRVGSSAQIVLEIICYNSCLQ